MQEVKFMKDAVSRILGSPRYRAAELLCLIAFCLVVAHNVSGVTEDPRLKLGESFDHVARATNIDQTWKMFAPYPTKSDGWFVLRGTHFDGHVTDLLTGMAPTEERPASMADLYPSKQWQTYMMQIWEDEDEILIEPFANYLCRSHPSLKEIEINFFEERTPAMGEDFGPIRKYHLWSQACLKN